MPYSHGVNKIPKELIRCHLGADESYLHNNEDLICMKIHYRKPDFMAVLFLHELTSVMHISRSFHTERGNNRLRFSIALDKFQ